MSGRFLIVAVLLSASAASADPGETPLPDPPAKRQPPKSLRDEAIRVSNMLSLAESRVDPEQFISTWTFGRWSSNSRVNNLEGGAAVATLAGEAIMGLDGSPIAAFGAFVAAITLDSAAADVEAANPPTPKQKKPVRHRLR